LVGVATAGVRDFVNCTSHNHWSY